MPHWRVDVSRLYLAVETVLRYRGISARDAAQEIGVPASTLSRIKDGHRPDVDAFASIVSWLRTDGGRFIIRADGGRDHEQSKVAVNREDVLVAWSWAREALAGLPPELQPPPGPRQVIEEALERLVEETGQVPAVLRDDKEAS